MGLLVHIVLIPQSLTPGGLISIHQQCTGASPEQLFFFSGFFIIPPQPVFSADEFILSGLTHPGADAVKSREDSECLLEQRTYQAGGTHTPGGAVGGILHPTVLGVDKFHLQNAVIAPLSFRNVKFSHSALCAQNICALEHRCDDLPAPGDESLHLVLSGLTEGKDKILLQRIFGHQDSVQ